MFKTTQIMEVNFYCFLSAPVEDKRNAHKCLTEFLSRAEGCLQAVGDTFSLVWACSSLAPQPNHLTPEFLDGEVMLLPFSFQYSCLEQAHLRISLLKSLLQNLVYSYGYGIGVAFEYHLDE